MDEIKIERTGNVFSIASSQFMVTYPDGFVSSIWSPPWNDFESDEEEEAAALAFATKQWEEGTHKMPQPGPASARRK